MTNALSRSKQDYRKTETIRTVVIFPLILLCLLAFMVGTFVIVYRNLPIFREMPAPPQFGIGTSEFVGSVASNAFTTIDPATAVTNGYPSLFHFMPEDSCSGRYCLEPAEVQRRLRQVHGEDVNYVLVMARKLSHDISRHHPSVLPFENWNLYPVAPYTSWLPALVDTESGWGLAEQALIWVETGGATGHPIQSLSEIGQ